MDHLILSSALFLLLTLFNIVRGILHVTNKISPPKEIRAEINNDKINKVFGICLIGYSLISICVFALIYYSSIATDTWYITAALCLALYLLYIAFVYVVNFYLDKIPTQEKNEVI